MDTRSEVKKLPRNESQGNDFESKPQTLSPLILVSDYVPREQ
jgi:hypothetical protein